MQRIISGIQQIGVGIPNVYEAWKWYRDAYGMDVPIFDEAAEAALMLPYTGGEPRKRHAVLAVNLQGGSGFEVWQYTSRTPQPPDFEIQLGDLGIFAARIKARNVRDAYNEMKAKGFNLLGDVNRNPDSYESFFVKDPYNNIFQIVDTDYWFQGGKGLTGGPEGVMIGVSNMEKSMTFYADILGFDKVIYDKEDVFDDLKVLSGGNTKVRRVQLTNSKAHEGAFSKLFGPGKIELIQALEREPRKIFENRLWGDLGFIHLCFDINGMAAFRELCNEKGHPFTVDTGDSFDMGEAAGAFSYIEDPDGTLIEFVETHKVPILKKIGWYLNLRKRDPRKPLPNWIIKALKFVRVKD